MESKRKLMLQAEVGGGGRVYPKEGLQKAGYLIRILFCHSAGTKSRSSTIADVPTLFSYLQGTFSPI